MSDIRPPYRVSLHRIPEIQGKKSLKIEQFHARYWRNHSGPLTRLFSPPLPMRPDDVNRYFTERFRLRIDGRWYRAGGKKFTMLTQGEVDGVVNRILEDGQEKGC